MVGAPIGVEAPTGEERCLGGMTCGNTSGGPRGIGAVGGMTLWTEGSGGGANGCTAHALKGMVAAAGAKDAACQLAKAASIDEIGCADGAATVGGGSSANHFVFAAAHAASP